MSWLKKYYGKDFETLAPIVVEEGDSHAIVKLSRPTRGFSGVGYVLIYKHGSHATSSHTSLHEGMPTAKDMERMKQALKKAEQE